MALLFIGIVSKFRKKDSTWFFVASGLITYFAPIALYFQLRDSVSDATSFLNAYDLFFYGSLALLFYLPFLLTEDSDVAVLFTPILLGITAGLLAYSKTTTYFAAIDPWLIVAVALPNSPAVGDIFALGGYTWPTLQWQAQQPTSQVKFIIKGLPLGVKAVVEVGNAKYYGDSLIQCQDYGNWMAFPVKVGQSVYYPNPGSGYANPMDIITVNYVLVIQQTAQPSQTFTYSPSRALSKSSFDPDALLNRRLGVYKVKSIIGSGGFGYVYLGKMGGEHYAIKVLKVDKGDPVTYFRELFNEANNLVDLSNHPNIVKVYAVNVDLNVIKMALSGDFSAYYADPPRIVMEYMGGGSLDEYLLDDKFFYSLNWERAVKRAVKQVAEALAHIHGRGYVHSDVKPQNIFLTERPGDSSELPTVNFKLGDLGSAIRSGKDISQVTIEYYPPEVFRCKASPSMDVFALGTTLYVLLTRKTDRPDLQAMTEAFDCYINNDMNCVNNKVDEARRLLASWDPQVPEPYKGLIKAMVNPDPMKRSTALEVANKLK
ncbi:hypothetical protein HS5_04440 [Acidianus sp. HS-5]|nr:hypothetical protein HS5_04440 [Acidianus sp. HS-5]